MKNSYIVWLLSLLFGLSAVCHANEILLKNPGFEDGFTFWNYGGTALVSRAISEKIFHSGKKSLHITNQSEISPNVYGTIFQNINVRPNTKYKITLWIKARNAKAVWFIGGRNWSFRKHCNDGTYYWRPCTGFYTTAPDETTFTFRINVDGKTDDVWIDDISIKEAETPVEIHSSSLETLGALSTYPLTRTTSEIVIDGDMSDWSGILPVLNLPSNSSQIYMANWKGNDDLSADVRMSYNNDHLLIAVTVLDDIHNGITGASLWKGDSVQIAFTSDGITYGPEYGFSLANGASHIYCYNKGEAEKGDNGVTCKIKQHNQYLNYEL